jgi:hypothetical protein
MLYKRPTETRAQKENLGTSDLTRHCDDWIGKYVFQTEENKTQEVHGSISLSSFPRRQCRVSHVDPPEDGGIGVGGVGS